MPRPHPCLAPLPAPLGLRFRALLGLGFVPPPEPRPCASIAYALLPAARVPLCRHRADPESSSRSLPSGSSVRIVPTAPAARIAPTVRRHPRHPPISLLALRRPQGPGWQEPRRMHPFFAECAKKAPSWQHPPEMHAFRDQDGNILAPCIHSRAQSGDSGCMARESCRQGPFFASRSPKSRMARRCCQRRPAFPRQRHAVRPNGLCALRRGPGLLVACALPVISLVSAAACASPPSRPRSSPPSYTRRASPPASRPPCAAIRRTAHCGRGEPSIRLFLLPSCCPRRANRTPALSQPGLARPWSHLRPPAPRHPPRLALPRGFRCGSGNSCEMVR